MKTKYEHVFEPIRIRGVAFKNRLEVAPMSPNLVNQDGTISPEFVNFCRPFARGGAGIITVGNAVIDPESRDEPRQPDLSTDECILPLTRLVEMAQGFGVQLSLEVNHSGVSVPYSDGKKIYGPSAIITSGEVMAAAQQGREPVTTIEMNHAKIRDTVEKYAAAAFRTKRAGCKMCMLHGAHGNLLGQFASPLYNKRTDEYGGSIENRARFALEVLNAVRERCGENFVIEYRISADEIHPKGMHFEETLQFIALIQDQVDILHVSAGLHSDFEYFRNWWQNYLMDRMFNVHYAADIKKAFPELLVCTVGSIMNVENADAIIAAGQADFAAMGRPYLADPEMPRKFALGNEADHRPCIRCQQCCARLINPAVLICAVNPFVGNETEFPDGRVKPAMVRKKVAVIGGGPAGIQALLTLCDRGHDVTLYEQSDHLGGVIDYAAAPSFKQDLKDYLDYMVRQANKAPGQILLNTEATKALLDTEGYDAIVIAVGAGPIIPKVPGVEKPHVHWAPEADSGKVSVGNKTLIIGAGAVGLECAIELAREGRDVAVIEMAAGLSSLMASNHAVFGDIMTEIQKLNIPIHFNSRLEEITDTSVICTNLEEPGKIEFPADTVLLALGVSPNHTIADSLRGSAPNTEVFVVGDAYEVTTSLASAVSSAFKAAAYI
ncbi:FAD-dependent oxidoreductase [Acetobacterium tundrae]|uniref:NAD(P)-binding protein n=1 Tax=Acetobacterium tundrae TaxID=132932 RepID=A0ABR6WLR9_9FIRM|nr:FAD-dependent oxidoreductase [Acetobacterium tundrae]MBC3797314.1 NAD(P)-binding protein [Acetobacterium tundrae]